MRGINEAALEARLSKILDQSGLLNWHNDPEMYPGIPDRYVVGGNWIELKVEPSFQRTMAKIERQRAWLDKLTEAGDMTWVVALVKGKIGQDPLLYAESWVTFKQRGPVYNTTKGTHPIFSYGELDLRLLKFADFVKSGFLK